MKEQANNKNKTPRVLFAVIPCGAALPVCAAAAVFFRRAPLFGAVQLLLSVWALILCLRHKRRFIRYIPAAGLFVCGVLAIFLRGYFRVMLIFTVSFAIAAAGLSAEILPWRKKGVKKHLSRQLLAGFFAFIIVLPIVLGWYPDPFFRYVMQEGVMKHVPAPSDYVREDGVRVIEDVEYPSVYPNNTMLMFLTPENRGTVFFVHGGGFVLGDKKTAGNAYFRNWLGAGYNVVSFDYALAPQYRADKQIVQCGEALRYFTEHAHEWGVDRERIVLAGESAGGCLSGLLAEGSVSPELASDLGVPTRDEYGASIRGWISIGGLVDVPRFGQTNDDLDSWAFNLMGVCAFHDPDYSSSETAQKFSVLKNASAGFPPSFISDGNHGTFTSQGEDLAEKLRSLGVRVETNFVPMEAGKREHVFEMHPDIDPVAADNFGRTLAFVDEIMP